MAAIRPILHSGMFTVPQLPEDIDAIERKAEEPNGKEEENYFVDLDFEGAITTVEPQLLTQRDLRYMLRGLHLSKHRANLKDQG